MNFVDSIIVKLADPAERAALFDDDSLAALVEAAYDLDAMMAQAPYTPVFDRVEIGASVAPTAVLDGFWSPQGTADRTELRVRAEGFGPASLLRIDALWRGSIVVRTLPADSEIVEVSFDWLSLDIDAEIVAALGALPADPVALEAERRTRLLARIRAGLDRPDAFTETHLGAWIASVGATSAGDFLEHYRSVAQTGSLSLTFSPPPAVPPAPKPLPFMGAILVRDADFSLADLLVESKALREQLRSAGVEAPPTPNVRMRTALVVVWIVRAGIFDDEAWPGASAGMTADQRRAARRQRAAKWLAREGIGLAVTP
jgi:hypothetical protein